MYWDLLETLDWISTRAEGVAAASERNGAMFSRKPALGLRSLLLVAEHDFETDREAAASQADRRSPDIDEAGMIAPSQTLNFLLRKVQIRRIRMTAIKCDRYRERDHKPTFAIR